MTSYANIPAGSAAGEYSLSGERAKQLIEAARAMGPALRMRRDKCKADARVPDETVQEFHDAGFFKILQPGAEAHPQPASMFNREREYRHGYKKKQGR